ncbi:glycosyltransferase [Sphingomonas koreensis]|nr:glycosyltransferase [Sphingomonas koreensis]
MPDGTATPSSATTHFSLAPEPVGSLTRSPARRNSKLCAVRQYAWRNPRHNSPPRVDVAEIPCYGNGSRGGINRYQDQGLAQVEPTVSVIIPAYQNALTLDRSIASLAAQSRRDWQAIIACDGPTDGTLTIAQRAAENDSRIQVITLENGGVSRARNIAIARAEGEWLLFLDADDTIAPRFFARMLRIARRNPEADVIACGFNRLDGSGRISARYAPLPLARDALAVCAAGPPGAIHSFLVKREIVIAAGGFDETLRTNEDWDLWLRLAQRRSRFATTPARLAYYWSTPNSLSRSAGQMVHDASIVQLRAIALDVAPRRGLEAFDRRSLTINELALRDALWSAGVAIGQGTPVPPLFDHIGATVDYRYQKTQLARQLFDGLVVGTGAGYDQLALRWPEIRGGVDRLLEELGEKVGGDVGPIARVLQVEIARAGRFSGEIDFGKVLGVSLTPRMLLSGYTPRTGADVMILRAQHLRPATAFSFAAPVLGIMTGRDIRCVIRRGIMRRAGTHIARHERLLGLAARANRARALGRRLLGAKRREPPAVPIASAGRAAVSQMERMLLPDGLAKEPNGHMPPQLHPGAGSDAADWDAFFETEDPWDYDSGYERLKYNRTLSLIAPRPEGRALEIACAEGRFTKLLAGIVSWVHAVDISPTALARAATRNVHLRNISFEQRDVFRQSIEGSWDVITCSEMLYFVPSVTALEQLARAIAAALRPRGQFVHAHAFAAAKS